MKPLIIMAVLVAASTLPTLADFGSGLPHDAACADAWSSQDLPGVIQNCAAMGQEAHAKAQADPGNAMTDLLVESEADILVGKAFLRTGDRGSAWAYAHTAYAIDEVIVNTVDSHIFPDLYQTALKMWAAAGDLQAQAGGGP